MGLIGLLRRKKKKAQEVFEEPLVEGPSGPGLFVLIPEVAGAPTYRVYRFSDGEEGTQFVDGSIAPILRPSTHIFWALHGEPTAAPPDGDNGEALVLIRPARNEDTIHIVSFVDIESAQSFARFEVKRGLDLGLLMIYWAAFAQVIETPFGLRLNPAEPPVHERVPSAAEAEAAVEPAPSASEDEPMSEASAESDEAHAPKDDVGPELRTMPKSGAESARRLAHDATPEPVEPEVSVSAIQSAIDDGANEAAPVEPTAGPEEAKSQQPLAHPERVEAIASDQSPTGEAEKSLADDDSVGGESPEPAAPTMAVETPGPEFVEPVASEQPLPEEEESRPAKTDDCDEGEPTELGFEQPRATTREPLTEPEPVEPSTRQEPVAEEADVSPVTRDAPLPDDDKSTAGWTEETPSPSAPPDLRDSAIAEAVSGSGADPETGLEADAQTEADAGLASESDDGDAEQAEIDKILKVKRWKKRDKPFSGFDSPPGRF